MSYDCSICCFTRIRPLGVKRAKHASLMCVLRVLLCVFAVECPCVFLDSSRVSPGLGSEAANTQCDKLQLWGCESANEIAFVCGCTSVCLSMKWPEWTFLQEVIIVIICSIKHRNDVADPSNALQNGTFWKNIKYLVYKMRYLFQHWLFIGLFTVIFNKLEFRWGPFV